MSSVVYSRNPEVCTYFSKFCADLTTSIGATFSQISQMYCTKEGIPCVQLHGMGQIDKAFNFLDNIRTV